MKEHRYKEAIQLSQEALKIDPKYAPALADLGAGYLRLGDDKKGLEFLDKAFVRGQVQRPHVQPAQSLRGSAPEGLRAHRRLQGLPLPCSW